MTTKELGISVRLHNDIPLLTAMSRRNHPPSFDVVGTIASGSLQHCPEVDLGKVSILHPLFKVRRALDLPSPPWWPFHQYP